MRSADRARTIFRISGQHFVTGRQAKGTLRSSRLLEEQGIESETRPVPSLMGVALRIIWRNPLRAIWHASIRRSDFVTGPIVTADPVPTHILTVKVASGSYDGT